MKTCLNFLFILFSIFFNVKDSQFKSGEVTYTISFNKLKSRVYGSKTKELIKNSVDVDYSLVFNNNESIYQKIKVMDNDVNPSINLTKIAAGADNVFYFNLTTNENLYNNKGHDELFLISQKKYNWKLTKENRKIGKYNCYKAIALNDGKISDVIAWYTIDIPLGFGPKYYNGLPGLILELNTKQVSFKATKIKLSEKQKNIEKPSEGIKITYEDYKKRFKGIFNDR